ncbi:hypothetical protein AMTRI_Chr01g113320 [Amborella trichopoda]
MARLCNSRLPSMNFIPQTLIALKSRSRSSIPSRSSKVACKSFNEVLVRRTRSKKEFQKDLLQEFMADGCHVPVLLGETLEVFRARNLRSFVDCTMGAGGHSSAIIRDHSELQIFIGLDVDPVAHKLACAQINAVLADDTSKRALKAHILQRNFRDIRSVISEIHEGLVSEGIDGILMDLGMSSMQVNDAQRGFSVLSNGPLDMRMNPKASLKATDILNSWPEAEIGRIFREFGEESNWRTIVNKIVKARVNGGLHSTTELVDLISGSSTRSGGRQGWMKTATRIFQALRIAVNDELKTLEDTLYAAFGCLSPGGRLAVISFHSLEDRIVKQTFLDIVKKADFEEGLAHEDERGGLTPPDEREGWSKGSIEGKDGVVLTKRPITPSLEEEQLNRRCRSAKLRVLEKK